jgi:hypothetical protein
VVRGSKGATPELPPASYPGLQLSQRRWFGSVSTWTVGCVGQAWLGVLSIFAAFYRSLGFHTLLAPPPGHLFCYEHGLRVSQYTLFLCPIVFVIFKHRQTSVILIAFYQTETVSAIQVGSKLIRSVIPKLTIQIADGERGGNGCKRVVGNESQIADNQTRIAGTDGTIFRQDSSDGFFRAFSSSSSSFCALAAFCARCSASFCTGASRSAKIPAAAAGRHAQP